MGISIQEQNDITRKIEAYLNMPLKKPSREEAIRRLRECGILDKGNRIAPAYRDIIVSKDGQL